MHFHFCIIYVGTEFIASASEFLLMGYS